MQRLIEGVVSYMQGNATISTFIGTGGPFWDIAPEGTVMPYVVISQIPGRENIQGFTSIYGAKSELQMTVRSESLSTTATKTETLAGFFDTLSSLTLSGGEVSRKPVRFQEPRYMAEPIAPDGSRVYAGVLQYVFSVQRTRGT